MDYRRLIPNMCTSSNLVFGMCSILSTYSGNLVWGSIFILLALVADGLDGRTARFFGVASEMGKEMDSLCDLGSFGIAPAFHDALLKGLVGAGYTFKTPGPASCCVFTVKDSDKPEFVDIAWKMKALGYKLYGTPGTCAWLNKHMVPCNEVRPISGEHPNVVDLLQSGLVDFVFSTSARGRDPRRDSVRLRRKAVELSIPCITAVDTASVLVDCLRGDHDMKKVELIDIAAL